MGNPQLIDSFGRRISYLRLSITDRCNLRCRYCMPPAGVAKIAHEEVLSYEELLRIASESVALGIEKIRVTGGEPLVRKGVLELLSALSRIEGLKQLVLTTNGVRLAELAPALRLAGVQRVNISLDSLRPEVFSSITRGGQLQQVLDGIAAAETAGLPIKINMVVMRGVNDEEVLDFAALTLTKPFTVRYIEYMPTTSDPDWHAMSMSGNEVLARIGERYRLAPLTSSEGAGPARNYRIDGAVGALGIITPISSHFCESCNRIRVTASGMVKGCLFAKEATDLKPYLRSDDGEALRTILRQIVNTKPGRHQLESEPRGADWVAMSQIGG